jgi:predicted Zn-dependent protease
MQFQFPIPADWRVINSPSTVLMGSPDKKAVIQLTLGKEDSPALEAEKFAGGDGVSVVNRRNTTVHGFSAVVLETRIDTQDGALGVLSYFIEKDDYIFVFHGYALAEVYASYTQSFVSVMNGFEQVRDRAVLEKKPNRLRVRQATTSGSLGTVLRQMGMGDDMLEELAVVNGMKVSDPVQSGDWIKTVGE